MKLPQQIGLREKLAGAQVTAVLSMIGLHLYNTAHKYGAIGTTDPAACAESIRKLSLEISNALVRAAADCDDERARRVFSGAPDIKLHTPYEPEADASTDPVGSGIIGKPVEPSNRTGA
jgi:hypothetical protein